jgi:hypothetical protein
MTRIYKMNQASFKGKTRNELTVNQVKAIMYAHTYMVDDKLIANKLSPSELRNVDLGKIEEFGSYDLVCRFPLNLINLPKHNPPFLNIIRNVDVSIAPLDGWTDDGSEISEITFYRIDNGRLSHNPSITPEFVRANMDKHFDYWGELSNKPSITPELLMANMDKPWSWDRLSLNPSITLEFVMSTMHRRWNWKTLSGNLFQFHPFIQKQLEYKKHVNNILLNHPRRFPVELCKLIAEYI